MLDLRQRLFIIIGLVAGLILALALLIIGGRDKEGAPGGDVAPAPPAREEELPPGVLREPPSAATPGAAPAASYSPDELYAVQRARIFVERLGSYSNQNDNQHIADAILMATDRMAAWLATQKLAPGAEYQGVVTKVVASSVAERSESQVIVTVDVQQVGEGLPAQAGAGAPAAAYKSGRVELLKIGNDWRVDALYWE